MGTYVTYVHATDLDEGDNGIVRYEFIKTPSNQPDYKKFVIDRFTGIINTANHIDREEQEIYFVSIYNCGLSM